MSHRRLGFAMPPSRVSYSHGSPLRIFDGPSENILFSLPYDETRYLKTLEACALLSDLRILEDGDESEIGERGVGPSPACGTGQLIDALR